MGGGGGRPGLRGRRGECRCCSCCPFFLVNWGSTIFLEDLGMLGQGNGRRWVVVNVDGVLGSGVYRVGLLCESIDNNGLLEGYLVDLG